VPESVAGGNYSDKCNKCSSCLTVLLSSPTGVVLRFSQSKQIYTVPESVAGGNYTDKCSKCNKL